MKPASATYDGLVARVTAWAGAQPNVRAAAIIGSRARQRDPADEWSDLDVLLLARKPSVYLSDANWLHTLGRKWWAFVDRAPVGGVPECRAMFDGALEVDFAILSARDVRLARLAFELLSRVPSAKQMLPRGFLAELAGMSETFGRGATCLVDKDGLLSPFSPTWIDGWLSAKPSEEEFIALTSRFWHGSVWVAKHLRRGELWRAKDGCDARMKMSLLRLTEWHAKAGNGWNLDTWAQGRFLERWADPRVVAALANAFAHYETEDVWRALFATMELFRWLARETASRLNMTYPILADERASEWVSRCFSERGRFAAT